MPDDFTAHAQHEGDLRLRARYGANYDAVKRWRQETGIYCGEARGPRRQLSRSGVSKPAPYRTIRKPRYNATAMTETLSWYDGEDDLGDILALL